MSSYTPTPSNEKDILKQVVFVNINEIRLCFKFNWKSMQVENLEFSNCWITIYWGELNESQESSLCKIIVINGILIFVLSLMQYKLDFAHIITQLN